jgi:hypothetical protein
LLISDVSVFEFFAESFTVLSVTVVDGVFTYGKTISGSSMLEKLVKQCFGCQKNQNMPAIAPLHPWEWPSSPWERVHIDFAGPFLDPTICNMIMYSC